MQKIKYRAWDKDEEIMYYSDKEEDNGEGPLFWYIDETGLYFMEPNPVPWYEPETIEYRKPNQEVMQYIGLIDCEDQEYFIGDIGQFGNGDKFILKMEAWLEVFVEWIGEPECEDQARDLYKIERAKIIGNIYENPKLLESKK